MRSSGASEFSAPPPRRLLGVLFLSFQGAITISIQFSPVMAPKPWEHGGVFSAKSIDLLQFPNLNPQRRPVSVEVGSGSSPAVR